MRELLWQWIAITKTYAMRPLMWLAVGIFALGYVALRSEPRSLHLRNSYDSPFDQSGSGFLRDPQAFLQWVDDGTVHPEITGIDFVRMGSAISLKNVDPITRRAEIRPFAELQHALTQFPNLQTICFDRQQLTEVQPATLDSLKKLTSLQVQDHPITDDHLQAIADIKSLEYLSLQTIDLPASLVPLASLPRLRTLSLSAGSYIMTDRSVDSPYRRQTLAQMHSLPALQELVLKPPYLPGIGYFGGSTSPDPACDPVLKLNAAEVLKGHPSLTHLWIGARERAEERVGLERVADELPGVQVSSAVHDTGKTAKAGLAAATLVLALAVWMLQLTSHFSGPASQCVPHFASRHLSLFALLALSSVVIVAVPLHTQGIHWLSTAAVLTFAVAVVTLTHASWAVFEMRPTRWINNVPAVIWVCLILLPFLFYSSTRLSDLASQFFIGQYPAAAAIMLLASAAVSVAGLAAFSVQHRIWAEQSLQPATTIRQLGERVSSIALRRQGDRFLSEPIARWNRKLTVVSRRFAQGSPGAAERMWQLGQAPVPLLRMAILIAVLSGLWCWFGGARSAMAMQAAVHYSVFMMIATALLGISISCLTRRATLALDLLRPIDRSRWIQSVFTSVLVQVSGAMILALLTAVVQLSIFLAWPSVDTFIRGLIAMAALSAMATGSILLATINRSMVLSVFTAVLCCGVVTLVCLVVVDTGLGPSPAVAGDVRAVIRHPGVLTGIWLTSVAMFGFAYIRWTRAEFALE
ncbi:MAG: leucine-rich repeat domain-containing protein [Planctomycetaceae bacterium]